MPKESRLANLKELKESLSDLRNFVPSDSAYSVVKNDIKKIERDVESDDAYKKDTQRTCDWSALILGTRSVNDILTDDGKAWLHFLFDLSGILFLLGVFAVVGSFLYGIFYVLTHAFNIDLSTLALSNGKDLVSTLSTVLSILAAVGLSLSLVAQKAWSSVKSFEPWIAVWLANRHENRCICQNAQSDDAADHGQRPVAKRVG